MVMTEINSYGNLTVENIEVFLNKEIENARKQVERYNEPTNEPFTAHLLHESLLSLAVINSIKKGLTGYDLNIECGMFQKDGTPKSNRNIRYTRSKIQEVDKNA